jgi:uncharacterized protein YecE (DUF72 family)
MMASISHGEEICHPRPCGLMPRSGPSGIDVASEHATVAEFAALLRKFAIPAVYTDHARYPNIADVTGDFVYARLQRGDDEIPTAYPPKAITQWSKRLQDWAAGGEPDDLERIAPLAKGKGKPRDVFAYVIHEGQIRAPAGAMALIDLLQEGKPQK